jgi:hypothetical protein
MNKLLLLVAALLACSSASAEYKGSTVTRVYDLYTTAGADVERTVAGTPSCVEDGGTTQITAGVTDTGLSEFDTHVGLNLFTVVATAANGFEAGKDYDCGVRTSTLNGVTATYRVVSFSVEARAPLKGSILERDTAAGSSTVSLVNFDTAATIASANEHITNLLVNVTQGWQRCITATATGTPDTASIYPNSPAATADNDVLKIVTAPVPCYPINLNGAQVEVVTVNGTPLTAQAGENFNRAFDNASVDLDESYLDVLAANAAAGATAGEGVADALADIAGAVRIVRGTATGGSTTTVQDTVNLTVTTTGFYNNRTMIVFTGGNVAGHVACIRNYVTNTATFAPAAPNAIVAQPYVIIAAPQCATNF